MSKNVIFNMNPNYNLIQKFSSLVSSSFYEEKKYHKQIKNILNHIDDFFSDDSNFDYIIVSDFSPFELYEDELNDLKSKYKQDKILIRNELGANLKDRFDINNFDNSQQTNIFSSLVQERKFLLMAHLLSIIVNNEYDLFIDEKTFEDKQTQFKKFFNNVQETALKHMDVDILNDKRKSSFLFLMCNNHINYFDYDFLCEQFNLDKLSKISNVSNYQKIYTMDFLKFTPDNSDFFQLNLFKSYATDYLSAMTHFITDRMNLNKIEEKKYETINRLYKDFNHDSSFVDIDFKRELNHIGRNPLLSINHQRLNTFFSEWNFQLKLINSYNHSSTKNIPEIFLENSIDILLYDYDKLKNGLDRLNNGSYKFIDDKYIEELSKFSSIEFPELNNPIKYYDDISDLDKKFNESIEKAINNHSLNESKNEKYILDIKNSFFRNLILSKMISPINKYVDSADILEFIIENNILNNKNMHFFKKYLLFLDNNIDNKFDYDKVYHDLKFNSVTIEKIGMLEKKFIENNFIFPNHSEIFKHILNLEYDTQEISPKRKRKF